MTIRRWQLTTFFLLGAIALAATGCGIGNAAPTPPTTRLATQTPWIIYVPVTFTPEPATVTPLPTVTLAAKGAPTRTPTRQAAAATKAPAVPTKAAVPPPAAPAATPTAAAEVCTANPVTLLFPENGTMRQTKKTGPGSDTFDFQWVPVQSGEDDPRLGYMISVASKRANFSNGVIIYISHNRFLRDGKHYILDARAVHGLSGGESVAVTWNVKVIKSPSGFNDNDPTSAPIGVVTCSTSATWTIELKVPD